MASRNPIELVFGDEKFTIRPLTFKQVQSLSAQISLMQKADDPTSGEAQMTLAREAITIALSRDHGDVKLDDLECDVGELPKQLLAIMGLGGFGPKEDLAVGEATAAAGRGTMATSAGV